MIKKKILADDKKEELSRRLNEIKIGDMVEIVYYKNGEYFTISGNLQKTDKNKKIIRINEKNVNICDISEIIL